MGSTRILPLARAGVELSVRALPHWRDRLRYRAEFLAELHELSTADQLRYAAGVLSQTFALRAALGSAPSRAEEQALTITTTRTFFGRCRVLRWHRWVVRSAEDGSHYLTCARSGRDRDEPEWGPLGVGLGGGA